MNLGRLLMEGISNNNHITREYVICPAIPHSLHSLTLPSDYRAAQLPVQAPAAPGSIDLILCGR